MKNLAFHSRVLIFVWSVLLFDTFSVFARRIQKEEESLNNNKTNDYDFLIHFSDTQSPRVVAGQPDGQRNLPRVSKQEMISFWIESPWEKLPFVIIGWNNNLSVSFSPKDASF